MLPHEFPPILLRRSVHLPRLRIPDPGVDLPVIQVETEHVRDRGPGSAIRGRVP